MSHWKYAISHSSKSSSVHSLGPVGLQFPRTATAGAIKLTRSNPATMATRIFRLLICITNPPKVDIIFKYFGFEKTVWHSGTYRRGKNCYFNSWGNTLI